MITTPLHGDTERYFIECCRTKLKKEYLQKIEDCLSILTDEDIWWRAHETNNSIGNLVLHLSGNIRQWIFHHLGGNEFERERDKEFAERNHISKADLIHQLQNSIADVDSVLEQFPTIKLRNLYTIQGYSVTGLEAILHITEHFSYHVGQIVYITKMRTGKDLKFYNL
ncbi:MAG: DinB family protein [Bacteroidota bacterium]|nr:DinB family protein [Bacteroidota bacterium]